MAKHPIVEYLDTYFNTHDEAFDSITLGAPRRYNEYLKNRLHEAFQAGWDAHEKHSAVTQEVPHE